MTQNPTNLNSTNSTKSTKNTKNIKILFFSEDMVFANMMKNYLLEYDFNLAIEIDFKEIFNVLNSNNIDVLILPIFSNHYDVYSFFDALDSFYGLNAQNNLKIFFISPVLPEEKVFKFIEGKKAYFMMQYTLPDIWVKKINAVL